MAKQKNSAKSAPADKGHAQSLLRLRESILLLLAAAAIYLFLSLVSYHNSDPGWSYSGSSVVVHNIAGRWGAWSADLLLSWVGFFAYLLPFLLAYLVPVIYRERNPEQRHLWLSTLRYIGALLIFFAGSGIASISLQHFSQYLPQGAGGIIGTTIVNLMLPQLNFAGSIILLWALFLLGLTWFCGVPWSTVFHTITLTIKKAILWTSVFLVGFSQALFAAFKKSRDAAALRKTLKANAPIDTPPPPQGVVPEEKSKTSERMEPIFSASGAQESKQEDEDETEWAVEEETPPAKALEPTSAAPRKVAIVAPAKAASEADVEVSDHDNDVQKIPKKHQSFKGKIPSLNLLDKPEPPKNKASKQSLEETARLVETKLADFGIIAKVTGICPGPIVTRYEIELAPGVKVSKLSGLNKDLARALSAMSVRVVETIPGKAVVGIEIPNEIREIVRLREVLDTKAFQESRSPLIMALGKDIAGKPELADLGKMPHLLVAGTTGSGKSVGLNAMLLSFLFKATPEEVRLIMIDPKMLELSIYEGIPHLLTPVVTDMKQAANALLWCVKEMDRRYRLMSMIGVRNIAGMNEKVLAARAAGDPLLDPLWKRNNPDVLEVSAPELDTLPYIVVLVDEFADMIMVVGKKVEELIARLAQKARAAGIHLILATQRPSVDVITGLIKANIPTRIAFQVSSKIDSRTILDQQGAEQLLGYGDMLYLPPGTGVPNRVHGAYVSDQEVHAVVSAWKELGQPEYISEILVNTEESEEGDGEESSGEQDPLYDQAVQIVLETQRASISGVQRRLKIGYNRAARLLEDMEKAGMVSQIQSNGLREILVSQGQQ